MTSRLKIDTNECSNTSADDTNMQKLVSSNCRTSDTYIVDDNTRQSESNDSLKGYGSQKGLPHPFYRTTSQEYGWHPPGYHTVPSVYFPTQQKFSTQLAEAGMYRNHSLNTSMDPPPYN